jgi:hypothetical protein
MLRAMKRIAWWLGLGLAACGGGEAKDAAPDAAVTPDAAPAARSPAVVPGRLQPIVLGVFAAAPDDVWFVGGGQGPGAGLLARYDGAAVRRVPAPAGGPLWWIWGADATRLWAVGEGGRVLSRRGDAWVAETTGLGADARLWGVWGSGPGDLWAVGGSVTFGGPKGLVLRSAGDGTWTRLEDPALPADANLFKVWGAGPDDVHLVGEAGVALHWDGAALRRAEVPFPDQLFTVHGRPGGPVLAVGGNATGRALRWEGGRWVDDAPPTSAPFNGVWVRDDGSAVVTGADGTILERSAAGAWSRVRVEGLAAMTLHAVSAAGDLWAVGGDLGAGAPGVVVTDRRPLPALEIGPPPPADAGVADAGPADAEAPDAAPVDGGAPDGHRPDPDASPADGAPADTGPADAGPADAQGRDAAPPDMAPPDMAPPDMAVPEDVGPPVPGPGELCPTGACREGLVCMPIAWDGWQGRCIAPCADASECGAYGPGACCAPPGPQIIERHCIPLAASPGGCP